MSSTGIQLTLAMNAITEAADTDRIIWFDGQEYINVDDAAHVLAPYMSGE